MMLMVCMQFYDGPRTEKYQTYNAVLTNLNMAFTTTFLIEMILKLLAFGIRVRTPIHASLLFCFVSDLLRHRS